MRHPKPHCPTGDIYNKKPEPSRAAEERRPGTHPGVRREDVGRFGGKNSPLGEMVSTLGVMGLQVPPSFATTLAVYWQFIEANDLRTRMSSLRDDLARRR